MFDREEVLGTEGTSSNELLLKLTLELVKAILDAEEGYIRADSLPLYSFVMELEVWSSTEFNSKLFSASGMKLIQQMIRIACVRHYVITVGTKYHFFYFDMFLKHQLYFTFYQV